MDTPRVVTSSALRAGSSRPLHKGQVNEPQNSTQFRGPRDPARSPQFWATLIKVSVSGCD